MRFLILSIILYSLNVFAIRNGQKSSAPFVAKIKIGTSYCTAVRVSETQLLSVAHCFTESSKKKFTVHYKQNGKTETEEISVNNVIFKGHSTGEEIVIIPINNDLKNTLKNEIIDISELVSLPSENEVFKAYGYGYDTNAKVGQLRLGELKSKSITVNDGFVMLITGPTEENQLPCPGDSGGPLVKEIGNHKEVIGIVSFINNSKRTLDPDKEEQRQRRRRNYSFNKFTYVCKEANQAYYILLNQHKEFLQQHLNLD